MSSLKSGILGIIKIDGKKYLIDDSDILYDLKNREAFGMYDRDNKKILYLEFESDDEDEDEETQYLLEIKVKDKKMYALVNDGNLKDYKDLKKYIEKEGKVIDVYGDEEADKYIGTLRIVNGKLTFRPLKPIKK